MSLISSILGLVGSFFSSILDFFGGIIDRFCDVLDSATTIFTDTPELVSTLGGLFENVLWFIPVPARFFIYSAVFGVMVWAIVKLVIKIVRG